MPEVGITYDSDEIPGAGDFLRSVSTGRTWLITSVKTTQSGPNAGIRHRLRCVQVAFETPDATDMVHPLHWYPRS